MLARFIKWLIDYKECKCDNYHKKCEDKLNERLFSEDIYSLKRYDNLAHLFDKNNKNIEAHLNEMKKRFEIFFERQKCFFCGKIAKDCEASKTHPYEKD